jgi:hypothetical protein
MFQLLPLVIVGGLAYLGYRGLRKLMDQTLQRPPMAGKRRGPIHEIEARACSVCKAFVADGAACNRPDCPRH